MTVPTTEPRIESIEVLRQKLQMAIALEFCTIPAYLSGWLTIKDRRRYQVVADTLLGIAIAEMRHLSIACNTLIAVGGSPDIRTAVPQYPGRLPDQDRDKLVRLVPFGQAYWELGLFVEQPDELDKQCQEGTVNGEIDLSLLTTLTPGSELHTLLTEHILPIELGYRTIGAFYQAVIDGIQLLVRREGEAYVFPDGGRVRRQYTHFGGQDNITVAGSGDAVTLLRDIIDEGEGGGDQMRDENGQLSHYYCFDQLRKKKAYRPGDVRCRPTGGLAVPEGDDIVNTIWDPMMASYDNFPEARKHADEFNRLYTRIVDNLQIGFNGHPQQVDTAIGQMHQLEALADRVLACELYRERGIAFHAAPTFEIPPYRKEAVNVPETF